MKLAIAQHVQSFEALDRQLAYATISDDPQNFQRGAARERTQELDACLASGVPCFLIVDKEESRGSAWRDMVIRICSADTNSTISTTSGRVTGGVRGSASSDWRL